MKKLISILLSVMLVVSGLSLSTFAADEAYFFDFDTGLLAGSNGSSNTGDDPYVTGEDYKVFNTSDSIYIKGWCFTVSGVASYWFNLAGAGWEQIPDDGITDRSEVYAVESMTQTFVSMGIELAPNTKTGFDYRIPLAGKTLADGLNTLQVKIVTNDGNEIVIADVKFDYCDPEVLNAPIPYTQYDQTFRAMDQYRTYRGDAMTASVEAAEASGVAFIAGNADAAGFFGWFSSGEEILNYGYSINGGDIVYSDAFVVDATAELAPHAPYTYYSRFEIKAPTTDLAIGEYTATAYCQLVNGVQLILGSMNISVTARQDATPAPDYNSVTEFMADASCTFDYDWYEEGVDLSNPSSSFAGRHWYRAVWSPRPITAANGAVVGKSTLKVDAATGNKYAYMESYYAYYSDYRWASGYTFSTDISVADSSDIVRGMHLNFSNEGKLNMVCQGTIQAIIPLFEAHATVDGLTTTGATGINVHFKSANEIQIAVLTYDEATETKGAVVATIALDSALALDTFKTVSAVDNGTDAIFILIEDTLVAKIAYSNAGILAQGPFYEGYYRTATVYGADGTVYGTTDKALISKLKTVGLGTRSSAMSIDNISLTEAKEVVDTTIDVAPTEITLVDGSIYTIDTAKNIIVVKSTAFSSGVNYATLMSNFATPKYIQLVNASGKVVTSGGRLSSKYTINLVDGDGNVVKTYALAFLGDLNADGRVNGTDVQLLQSNLSSYTSGTAGFYAANVNGDRRINGTDVAYLQGMVKIGTFA